MPCFNPGPDLHEAVASVLAQPECLELVVADGGSNDGSIAWLQDLARHDLRLRLVSEPDNGPAEALQKAFKRARGTLIGWLNADDLYTPGALARAATSLEQHPHWLMVYGEGQEFNAVTGLCQRYPTLPPAVGLAGFRSHCYICQPTVVFRRSMVVLLGGFDRHWRTAFDFDLWLRAFAAFPERIGYIPHLQARTRLHEATITARQRQLVALEATKLLARHFGSASAQRLHNYALELQLGLASMPEGINQRDHLDNLACTASPWLEAKELAQFRRNWLLNPKQAQDITAAESEAAAQSLDHQLPVQLLMALHPQLMLDSPGPPAGPHRRLQKAVEEKASRYPLLQSAHPHSEAAEPLTPFSQRPFGVNLIGHAFEVFGIGEDIRMAARALQAADVPCCVIHHPANNGAASSDLSLEHLLCADSAGGPYAFNLVCMAAPIHGRWLLQGGLNPLRERYTLAAWPWETDTWPRAWLPLLKVADELWPSSRFTADALTDPARTAGLPLHVMPMAAEISAPEHFNGAKSRETARLRYQLPMDAVVFGFGFDLKSTAIRKNPMGTLEAFQQAFPPDAGGLSERVALMIKTFPPRRFSAEWHWLQARAEEDHRIHLVVESLDRDDLLALYGCCDVFLSLHRSEGFGRGMAEALQLGLDVIATDYSGNIDFCTGPLAHPVRWRPAPIPRGAYPCADGHSWAEPDLDHAVQVMRDVATQRLDSSHREHAWKYHDRFSFATTGARYRARLEALWEQRDEIGRRLRWQAATEMCP
jgi:hypothetical protein